MQHLLPVPFIPFFQPTPTFRYFVLLFFAFEAFISFLESTLQENKKYIKIKGYSCDRETKMQQFPPEPLIAVQEAAADTWRRQPHFQCLCWDRGYLNASHCCRMDSAALRVFADMSEMKPGHLSSFKFCRASPQTPF